MSRWMARLGWNPSHEALHRQAAGTGHSGLTGGGQVLHRPNRMKDSFTRLRFGVAKALAVPILLGLLAGCGKSRSPEVVIYTSQDEVYAEPIFKDFETQTGIKVRPVYDSESVKTVGLVNRLMAESANPQC